METLPARSSSSRSLAPEQSHRRAVRGAVQGTAGLVVGGGGLGLAHLSDALFPALPLFQEASAALATFSLILFLLPLVGAYRVHRHLTDYGEDSAARQALGILGGLLIGVVLVLLLSLGLLGPEAGMLLGAAGGGGAVGGLLGMKEKR